MTDLLKAEAAAGRVALRITPSMSFLDTVFLDLPFSIRGDLQLRVSALDEPDVSPEIDCVVGQVGDPRTTALYSGAAFREFQRTLRRLYPRSHRIYVVATNPIFEDRVTRETTVGGLPRIVPELVSWHFVVVIPPRTR